MTAGDYRVDVRTQTGEDQMDTYGFSVAALSSVAAVRGVLRMLDDNPDAWVGELVEIKVHRAETLGAPRD